MNGRPSETTQWPRIIVHADMDAFYAAIEQLDNPELRGRPVLVGGPSQRGVVSTASYEARPFGVGSAMPMARALRLCPDAVVVRPRFDRYTEVSAAIMRVFRDFSPRVEALSLDEAFLDMTGARGLFGGPEEMGRQIKAAVREVTGGLTVSVGVANTKFLAKVASDFRKPDGLTVVPPNEVEAFLHPLPIRRLWGVGPRTQKRLERLGLERIAQVARSDPAWLERELGSLGRHIYRLACNDDPREVIPHHRAKSVGAEMTLARNVRGHDEIQPHLLTAADRVARRLRKKGLRARGLRVKLKTARFRLTTRQLLLPQPTDHADTLYEAALELLPRFDLRPPMRLVGLAAFDLVNAGTPIQGELFKPAESPQVRELDHAVDELRHRFGDLAVQRARDLDHRWKDVADPTGPLRDRPSSDE